MLAGLTGFEVHFGTLQEGSAECKMEAFLTQLAKQGVAASTQNQALGSVKTKRILKMGKSTPIRKPYCAVCKKKHWREACADTPFILR